MNPLDRPGQEFCLDLRNPNPRSRRTKDGPVYLVTFEIDQETYLWFMDAKDTAGMYIACAAMVVDGVEGGPAPTEPEQAKANAAYGKEAEELWKSRAFGLVEFARAVGSDSQFHAWVQRQSSCISGTFSEYVDGEGRCIAAHVRRADAAGTAFKPEYHQIPLTDAEHQMQHQNGEAATLIAFGILDARQWCAKELPGVGMEWFDEAAFDHRHKWVWETLKAQLGYAHWNEVPPAVLARWAADRNLLSKLPRCYQRAMEES